MQLKVTAKGTNLAGIKVDMLLRRMVSPLVGLDKTVAWSLRDAGSPPMYTVVAQMTGIHRLLGLGAPLSYHLGGYGLNREEAFMRLLGETTERYSHMSWSAENADDILFESYCSMQARGLRTVDPAKLTFYESSQINGTSLKFRPFDPSAPLGWCRLQNIPDLETVWIPAQLIFVGYRPRVRAGEPWLNAAMTTGTAAHTIPEKALLSAILELIQMDTSMGYWYSATPANRIVLDRRTPRLNSILSQTGASSYEHRFHYMSNPDLPGHVVACLLWNRREEMPAAAIGVACELEFESACYKAFLEASAIPQLALFGILRSPGRLAIDPRGITDLDMNVVYYALPENRVGLEKWFPPDPLVCASELPSYRHDSVIESFKFVVDAFCRTKKELYVASAATRDIQDLGFYVLRTYSPDLLSLCFPSFPTKSHPRFLAYGGVKDESPHPYP